MALNLDKSLVDHIQVTVAAALAEDIGGGDLSANLIPQDREAKAIVITRQDCVLCGGPWFSEVYRQLDVGSTCRWLWPDGEYLQSGTVVCEIAGRARTLLTGERTALNFLQLLSAGASVTREYVSAVTGNATIILDTRKTLPGLRRAQKYAVRCGGGQNHRMGLYDAILIKENHIASAGSIRVAMTTALERSSEVGIEVEVENLEQMQEALDAGARRILLDNFSKSALDEAVSLRGRLAPDVVLEASGGITLDNVRTIAETGVDYISIGALTKDVHAIDFSMRFL